ncbi:MAG TPA: hypothetical protein VHC98_01475 [Candidatus Saccharimonadales bacterium]|nr:hypothetical protein [Candidatus Saccharimonadales bacterium]
MSQTFDDMLRAEPVIWRRAVIWARALWDLPVSAAKEHLTNGKDIAMNRTAKIIVCAIVLGLALANAASFWFGNLHARQTTIVEHVTAVQIADAMQQDHFYSDYGSAALIFSGRLVNLQQKAGTTLAVFQTGRPYTVTCQFAEASQVHTGDTITVVAPGGSADRQPHGVLLHHCVLE